MGQKNGRAAGAAEIDHSVLAQNHVAPELRQSKTTNPMRPKSPPLAQKRHSPMDTSDVTGPDIFVALHDYTARTDTEMSFRKDDKLRIRGSDRQNWWEAELVGTGQVGWIPSNYVAPVEGIESHDWYHGKISRSEAEYLLNSGVDGSFLVRESESTPGDYTISLRFEGKPMHYKVVKTDQGMYYVMDDVQFNNLVELVDSHMSNPDGLIVALKHPVPRRGGVVYGLADTDEWEIDRTEILMAGRLGSGQYGEVYKAKWKRAEGNEIDIAVKTFKEETTDAHEFIKEADVMKKIQHPNLVQLLGVCTEQNPLFIITEYMPRGNLLDFVRSEAGQQELTVTAMFHAAVQAASGMAYLEEQSFIHRDLAARNCLVGGEPGNLIIKIADFGLSRLLKNDNTQNMGGENIYTAQEGTKFPIKWTAPEALAYNTFTIKSDVWAYGILLWELATFGKTPYPGVDIYSVLDMLETGYRMERPSGCPPEIYDLMQQCWEWVPEDRPSFRDIRTQLESMFVGESAEEAVEKTLKCESIYVEQSGQEEEIEEIDAFSNPHEDPPKLPPRPARRSSHSDPAPAEKEAPPLVPRHSNPLLPPPSKKPSPSPEPSRSNRPTGNRPSARKPPPPNAPPKRAAPTQPPPTKKHTAGTSTPDGAMKPGRPAPSPAAKPSKTNINKPQPSAKPPTSSSVHRVKAPAQRTPNPRPAVSSSSSSTRGMHNPQADVEKMPNVIAAKPASATRRQLSSSAPVPAPRGNLGPMTGDKRAIVESAKKIYKRAQAIQRGSLNNNMMDAVKILVSDAQQMLNQAKLFASRNPVLKDVIGSTGRDLNELHSLAKAYQSGNADQMDLIARTAQRIMAGCRALCTAIQQ